MAYARSSGSIGGRLRNPVSSKSVRRSPDLMRSVAEVTEIGRIKKCGSAGVASGARTAVTGSSSVRTPSSSCVSAVSASAIGRSSRAETSAMCKENDRLCVTLICIWLQRLRTRPGKSVMSTVTSSHVSALLIGMYRRQVFDGAVSDRLVAPKLSSATNPEPGSLAAEALTQNCRSSKASRSRKSKDATTR